eukprot:s1468_g7.t1
MVAPGVRHSADCRRRQAEFRDLEQQLVAPQGEVEDAPYSPSLGPEEPADEPADVNMEELPEASSAPAEAASSAAAEQSAPEVAQEDAAYRVLFEALEKKVKIRETGRVTMSGGSLKFLGIPFVNVCFVENQLNRFLIFNRNVMNLKLSLRVMLFLDFCICQVILCCMIAAVSTLQRRRAGGEMTEVDYTGDGDVLTEVPDVPTIPPPTAETPVVPSASRVDEPETPVIATASDSASKAVKPKVKPMPRPRKTIVKRAAAKGKSEKPAVKEKQSSSSAKPKPAVKKMPRRIAVKQEKAESVRGRGSFRARQTEANRKRRHAWKARQKEAAEFFQEGPS